MKKTDKPRFTWAKLDELKKAGKIRDFEDLRTLTSKKEKSAEKRSGRAVLRFFPTRSTEKNAIIWNLLEFAKNEGLVLYEEFYFHPERDWRADWAFKELKLLIEYEGIMSEKSRHTTISGFSADAEKYNAAAALGFTVLRYTPLTYQNLITDLKKFQKC